MKFRAGTEPIDHPEHSLVPSGFSDRGFHQSQVQKLATLVQDAFHRFRTQSSVPPALLSALPEETSLYCRSSVGRGSDMATLITVEDTNVPTTLEDGSRILPPFSTRGITLAPSQDILRDRPKQFELEKALRHCFTAMIVNLFCHPVHFSRSEALIGGVENKGEKSRYLPDPRSVRTTTGLSTPDGTSFSPASVGYQHLRVMSSTALDDIALPDVWRLCEGMLQQRQTLGRLLSNAEVNRVIAATLPQEAEKILAHPAFAPIRMGPQAMVQLNRTRTLAYVWPFMIEEQPLSQAMLNDPSHIFHYRLQSRTSSPLAVRMRKFSRDDDEVTVSQMKKTASHQLFDMNVVAQFFDKKKGGYVMLDVEELGSFRLEMPK